MMSEIEFSFHSLRLEAMDDKTKVRRFLSNLTSWLTGVRCVIITHPRRKIHLKIHRKSFWNKVTRGAQHWRFRKKLYLVAITSQYIIACACIFPNIFYSFLCYELRMFVWNQNPMAIAILSLERFVWKSNNKTCNKFDGLVFRIWSKCRRYGRRGWMNVCVCVYVIANVTNVGSFLWRLEVHWNFEASSSIAWRIMYSQFHFSFVWVNISVE